MISLQNWLPGDDAWQRILFGGITLGVALLIALTIHKLGMITLHRMTARTSSRSDDLVLARAAGPTRWILLVLAASLSQRIFPFEPWAALLWEQATGFIVPALLGWFAISLLRAFNDVVSVRADITAEDNLQARRRRTRTDILTRIGVFLIIFITVCMMLLAIPGVRSVGVTLMASAGLAGLAVGAAAQPALKNLIAGIQMAFTEPIRIDDVVIIAGEWGRIEEIRLTFVIVKVWDERRLIIPISKFLDEPFQNWTRESAQLLGSVLLYLDPAADVARLRAKAGEVVEANPKWDRRFHNLQITDHKPDVMEVRILCTAKDASQSFDLRCDVREAMLAFIAAEMPEALPRTRLSRAAVAPEPAISDRA